MMTKEELESYTQRNYFMHYNHIELCTVSDTHSVVKVDLHPESMNLRGYVHGGLLCTMADCVAGISARQDGRDYVTQSFHMNYLRNVTGGTIYATADAVKRGRQLAIFHVTITDEKETLLADGVVDMIWVPPHN